MLLSPGTYTLSFSGDMTTTVGVAIADVTMGMPIGSLPASGLMNLSTSGAVMDLQNTNQSIASLSAAGTSVINIGALTTTDNTSQTFAGVLSGGIAGGLYIKQGSGVMTLSGSNTYTGGTLISGGTLQLGTGAGGQDGSLTNSGGITNNAALVYNLSASQTYSGVIGGSGVVGKRGREPLR